MLIGLWSGLSTKDFGIKSNRKRDRKTEIEWVKKSDVWNVRRISKLQVAFNKKYMWSKLLDNRENGREQNHHDDDGQAVMEISLLSL